MKSTSLCVHVGGGGRRFRGGDVDLGGGDVDLGKNGENEMCSVNAKLT